MNHTSFNDYAAPTHSQLSRWWITLFAVLVLAACPLERALAIDCDIVNPSVSLTGAPQVVAVGKMFKVTVKGNCQTPTPDNENEDVCGPSWSFSMPGCVDQDPNQTCHPIQYRSKTSDPWGAPPANSYTISAEPKPKAETSSQMFDVTLKLAGYWRFKGRGDVSYAAPKDNCDNPDQCWTGNDDSDYKQVVAITATATPLKTLIAAQSSCGITASESSTPIDVQTVPTGYENHVQLQIGDVTPTNSKPSGKGNVSGSGKNWKYTAENEPSSLKHPTTTRAIEIKILVDNVDTGNKFTIHVRSAYEYLTHPPVITKLTGQSGAGAQYMRAYNFITCKYASCLATTGGSFNSVTISDNAKVPCNGGLAVACTSIFDNVTFGIDAFSGGENFAASVVGHEMTHTVGIFNSSECDAYTWEVTHASCTGLQGNQLTTVQNKKNANCP